MEWTFFYMFVVLKIPIIAAFVLIWYAARAPEDEQDDSGGGGGDGDHGPHPRRPRPSRRGPHPERPPRAPKRVRARARRVEPVAARHS